MRAAAGRDAPITGCMRVVLIGLREHKVRLMLSTVAAGCVVAFACWLDRELRPALEARERSQQAAEDRRERFAPCLPNAVRSANSWCGAVKIPPPPPQPVTPLPLIAGAPAAFCTAHGNLSC